MDIGRRIKFGPQAFDPDYVHPELPDCLKNVQESEIYTNSVLEIIVQYFHKNVFDNKLGNISIEWSTEVDRLVAGDISSTSPDEHKIRINRSMVDSKMYLYLVIAHEMVHAYLTASTVSDHSFHGNPYIKGCEKFYEFDESMDVYIPDRSIYGNFQYVYECFDDECGKTFSVNNPKSKCTCGDDLICHRKKGLPVPAAFHFGNTDDDTESTDSDADASIEEQELQDLED